jgi:hypothetical protein
MSASYIFVETSESHPGLVRIGSSEKLPSAYPAVGHDRHIWYIARFNDTCTALMHAHQMLRRYLYDLENRIYKIDALTAVADLESEALKHERIYLAPELESGETREKLENIIEQRCEQREKLDRFWQRVGAIALLMLLANLLIFF